MPLLPSGTVTFLFTDIEGSTRLWEEHPEAMRPALARHDALMRAAIEQHQGYVFKTMGDAFCAAFPTATDAVNAALAAQQALNAEEWAEPVRIRVRMALHAGIAEERDNDYFGQPLNRVARLLSAGHGGQVLLSEAVRQLCHDRLPPAAELMDLGRHRLRDLSQPEQIFQLLHPQLPTVFPPLRSLESQVNNLPQQLTAFIGREQEIDAVTTLLHRSHLLTFTGSGGCGKSRLALQIAAEMLEEYPDGVWLVELAALAEPALVAQTVVSALGLQEQAGQTVQHTLIAHLRNKRVLLLLDNCEHLVAACATLVEALLKSCPHLKVLATSREALRIAAEQIFHVPSLTLPDAVQPCTREIALQYEAVRLFADRAALVKPDFAVTDHNAPRVAQVCRRLDGIPLAIELAAARVRSLSVEDIDARLDSRFRLLTGGNRTALPRQQTLRALIDWSYDLLQAQERLLLSRLSVFSGGWTMEAAEVVASGAWSVDREPSLTETARTASHESLTTNHEPRITIEEILDLLTSLVDKSLVLVEEQEETVRYRLLETVRQYAAEKLAASGEADRVRGRHRDWCVALAEEAVRNSGGAEQGMWLTRLETEHDNLRTALTRCIEDVEGAEAGLRLAGALCWFWMVRGHFSEGRTLLGRALEREDAQGWSAVRAKALTGAGALAYSQGDFEMAKSLYQEGLALFRKLGDKRGIAASLYNLGAVAYVQGDSVARRTYYEEGLAIHRELGDKRSVAYSLNGLGAVAHQQGDYEEAWSLFEESLSLCKQSEDRGGVATSLNSLGQVATDQGRYPQARELLEESMIAYRELGDRRGVADTLEGLAGVLQMQAETEQAVRLWGAADALRESIGAPMHPDKQERCAQQIAQARRTLGESTFSVVWEQGRSLTWEQLSSHSPYR